MTTVEDRQAAPPNAPSLGVHIVKQTAGFLLFFLLLLPVVLFRATLYISPRTRPHPSWSLRRSLAIAVGRLYLTCTTYLSLPRDPGAKSWKADDRVHKIAGKGTKVKVVLAPSLGDEWIVGVAREGKGWREGNEVAKPGEKVVMYVNGGSWVMGHPQSTMFPYKVAGVSGRRVLAVNHRKALSPSTAFPAQLLDLTAGYVYLLSRGFAPRNIVLLGDSSGGHLMLALTRYIAELSSVEPSLNVGMPGAMLLISPSCDLSHPPHPHSSTDYLVPYLNEHAYPSLTRHFPPSAVYTCPYFSPAKCGSFAYLASAQQDRPLAVWIQYGSVENLNTDIETLIEKMEGEGVSVDVDRVEGGVHLDAGIAYALGERGKESSWERFLDAVRRYTK